MKSRRVLDFRNLVLATATFVGSVVLIEVGLRVIGPRQRYYVLVPGTEWSIPAAPGVLRGIVGVSHYQVNSQGVRGRLLGPDSAEYRILVVGGSTTESAALDDAEEWTRLLERGLEKTTDGRRSWVGNVGRSGLTSREHVLQLAHLLPQLPRIDAVVALVGVNDVASALRRGWTYQLPEVVSDSSAEGADLRRAFVLLPLHQRSGEDWYRSMALWQLARRARLGWNARHTFNLADVSRLTRARAARAHARMLLDTLPPLEQPLREYRRNLKAMADQALTNRARLVLVTAPALWRPDMSTVETRDLWFGWLGTDWSKAEGYFTPRALARALDQYNRTLLEVCRERGLECVDLAPQVQRDTMMFYDDVHFTEAGSRRVAQVLHQYFATRPPFAGSNVVRP